MQRNCVLILTRVTSGTELLHPLHMAATIELFEASEFLNLSFLCACILFCMPEPELANSKVYPKLEDGGDALCNLKRGLLKPGPMLTDPPVVRALPF